MIIKLTSKKNAFNYALFDIIIRSMIDSEMISVIDHDYSFLNNIDFAGYIDRLSKNEHTLYDVFELYTDACIVVSSTMNNSIVRKFNLSVNDKGEFDKYELCSKIMTVDPSISFRFDDLNSKGIVMVLDGHGIKYEKIKMKLKLLQ